MPRPIRYNLGWRVNFSKDGKKVRKWFPISQHRADDAAAYSAACRFIEETLSGKEPEQKQRRDLRETIARYNDWSERVRRKAPETMRKQHHCLAVFSRFCEANEVTEIEKVDTVFCLEYQQWFYDHAPFSRNKRRDNYDPSANWHKYHQFLNAFFNWCMRRGYIEENPARHPDFKPKIQNKVPTIFTHDELGLIFDYFDQQDSDRPVPVGTFFRLLLYTGMRPGEGVKLKWADVNLQDGVIQVTGQTKTKQVRSIPIHPELRKILDSLPTQENTYVFDSGRNEPVGDDKYYYRELRRACVIMKIKHHRVYDFRHTFAANLVIGGVHIGAVRELLGHARIEQTLVYIHFAPQHLKSAVESLSF